MKIFIRLEVCKSDKCIRRKEHVSISKNATPGKLTTLTKTGSADETVLKDWSPGVVWATGGQVLFVFVALFYLHGHVRGQLLHMEEGKVMIPVWVLDFALVLGVIKFGLPVRLKQEPASLDLYCVPRRARLR